MIRVDIYIFTLLSLLSFTAKADIGDQQAKKETSERVKIFEADRAGDVSDLSGEGELGFTTTSGNSNTEALNAKLNAVYEINRWRHRAELRMQTAKDDSELTVDRTITSLKSDYRLSQIVYVFASVRHEDDAFSGFKFQRSSAAGIGWRVLRDEDSLLDLESGVGYKQSETKMNESFDEKILRLYGQFNQVLTETTTYTQELLIEAGNDSTLSEMITGLKVSINKKLALKLGFHLKKNSAPPQGSKPVDKSTAVTLVYGF